MHCFHLCSCGHNLNIEADLHLVWVVVVVVVVVVAAAAAAAAAAAVVVVVVVVVVVPSTRTGFGWTLRMLTSVHTYLWTVTLQHMAFPASTSCVMIIWVGEQTQR